MNKFITHLATEWLLASLNGVRYAEHVTKGCEQGTTVTGSMEVILSIHSALVRPYLESWVPFLAPQYKTDMDSLEIVQ